MAFVEVHYDPVWIDSFLDLLKINIPIIVAGGLHVESNPLAHLSSQDVQVRFAPFGKLDVTNHYELTVKVSANYYPERFENLDDVRIPHMTSQLMQMFKLRRSFCVYVYLGFGGCGKQYTEI